MLDEPNPHRRLQANIEILREVKEPYFDNLKQILQKLYSEFSQEKAVYIPSLSQQESCVNIAHLLRSYFGNLIEKFPKKDMNSNRINQDDFSSLLASAHLADHKFLSSFIKTQLLISHLENN